MRAQGMRREQLRSIFDNIDVNNSGDLDLEEFSRFRAANPDLWKLEDDREQAQIDEIPKSSSGVHLTMDYIPGVVEPIVSSLNETALMPVNQVALLAVTSVPVSQVALLAVTSVPVSQVALQAVTSGAQRYLVCNGLEGDASQTAQLVIVFSFICPCLYTSLLTQGAAAASVWRIVMC